MGNRKHGHLTVDIYNSKEFLHVSKIVFPFFKSLT